MRAWLARPEVCGAAPAQAMPGGARLFTRIAIALHALDGLVELRKATRTGAAPHKAATRASIA